MSSVQRRQKCCCTNAWLCWGVRSHSDSLTTRRMLLLIILHQSSHTCCCSPSVTSCTNTPLCCLTQSETHRGVRPAAPGSWSGASVPVRAVAASLSVLPLGRWRVQELWGSSADPLTYQTHTLPLCREIEALNGTEGRDGTEASRVSLSRFAYQSHWSGYYTRTISPV